jgi:hypothetical protein
MNASFFLASDECSRWRANVKRTFNIVSIDQAFGSIVSTVYLFYHNLVRSAASFLCIGLMLHHTPLQGDGELPGLTDTVLPNRLGPKRATKIRKFFNLSKEGDVRKYVRVVRREVKSQKKENVNPYFFKA